MYNIYIFPLERALAIILNMCVLRDKRRHVWINTLGVHTRMAAPLSVSLTKTKSAQLNKTYFYWNGFFIKGILWIYAERWKDFGKNTQRQLSIKWSKLCLNCKFQFNINSIQIEILTKYIVFQTYKNNSNCCDPLVDLRKGSLK